MNLRERLSVELTPSTRTRARELYIAHRDEVTRRTDRMFALLLLAQWFAALVLALTFSPYSWEGAQRSVHIHMMAALILGGVLTVPPVVLVWLRANATLTRHMIAVAQMGFSALLIHLSGGRIETHFHIFGSLAFLAFYRDWRVLITAAAVTAADHLSRGWLAPMSLYGVATPTITRSLEHAGWVAFEVFFLVTSCVRGQKEMWEIAARQSNAEDVTARHAASVEAVEREAALLAAANEASRSKSEFLANMSHEIRTPMTAVIGYADLLLDPGIESSDRLNHVQTIRRNGEHLLSVINDILDLSKIEAGKMTVESIACSPSQIIVDVCSLMRVRAMDKGLEFGVDFLTPIPETIISDPTRLRQTLLNLVGNAIKFTKTGSVRILARCDLQGTLSLEVADTGVGLSRTQIDQLFQPFQQADTSTTRKYGGTGLGLVICQRFTRMMGGDITVASLPGRGSSFTMTVNTGSLEGVRMFVGLTEAEIPEVGGGTTTETRVEPLRCSVLLAEDGIDNQVLISTVLKKAGASVVIAENGRIAYERALAATLSGSPFDVILMDMQMPELDGYGATAKLRQKGYRGPIIALTAHAMAGDRERCLSAGCDDYLTKPINKTRLIETTRRWAEKQRAEGPLVLRRPDDFEPRASIVSALPNPEPAPRPPSVAPNAPQESALYSEFASDPDMIEIIDGFVDGLPERMRGVQEALTRGAHDEVKRLAHQLKGAAGGYGFGPITAAAGALELGIHREVGDAEIHALTERLLALGARARRCTPTRMNATS